MIVITGCHLAGGAAHQHITSVQWLNTVSGKASRTITASMVAFIDKGSDVWVGGAEGWDSVRVVRPSQGEPYLRSSRDQTLTDNLLELPRF